MALVLIAPADAKTKMPDFVEAGAVKDKPTVSFVQSKAYLLIRSDAPTPILLMRIPDADDQAAYDEVRGAEYEKARSKYEKKLVSYDRAVARKAAGASVNVPEKPDEVNEQNFDFMPFARVATVSIGPMNRFAKGDEGASTYLQEVKPGSYRIYGLIMAGANGVFAGTCFCMGSVAFEAKAGEIVDLGFLDLRNQVREKVEGDSSVPMLYESLVKLPGSAEAEMDSRLDNFNVRPVRYWPVGKLPNYYGLAIGRMPEIPGVMRYDRDRIVDLTKGD
ncbi:MAG: hypothetical protein R3E02_09590 [Blastomonas sp.]